MVSILKGVTYDQCIIFYNEKRRGSEIAYEVKESLGEECVYINSDQMQSERIRLMNRFKAKKSRVIVSTDLLARGIDVQSISLVINYDLAMDSQVHQHRIGRASRWHSRGLVFLLLTQKDEKMLERLSRQWSIREFREEERPEINGRMRA